MYQNKQFLENRFFCHLKKSYKPKPKTTTQPIYTSAHLWMLPMPYHTTSTWSVTPVAALPISVLLFSFCDDPFRSDADPWFLSSSILICASPWCLSLICAAMSFSIPLCNAWHRSVSTVLLCAYTCCSLQIYTALCHSATSIWPDNTEELKIDAKIMDEHGGIQDTLPYHYNSYFCTTLSTILYTSIMAPKKWYHLIKTSQ